jgi:rod shape-determining protein MreD
VRDFFESAIELLAVVVLFSLLTKISSEVSRFLNVFNVLVFYFGYKRGEIQGAVMGTVCGLIQDSFSLGIFGLSGISKTLLGYGAGFISKRVNVSNFSRRLVLMLILFSAEMMIWLGLYSLILSEKLYTAKGLFFLQPVGTALLAFLLFPLFEKLEQSVSRQ